MPASSGYDGAGDRLAVTVAGSSSPGGTSYAYDGRDELTGESSTRGSGYSNVNHYDGYTSGTTTGPGNPTTLRGTGQSFNADNELTGTGLAYEGDGSPKTYKGSTLVFDPEARMTSYGSAQTDGYRGDGLRAWKSVSGVVTYFLYDGDDRPVCELNSSGTVTATDTFGADGLVSRHTTASAFYVFDPSGNVSERLTSTGTVASTDLTDGFGNRQTTDTTHDPFAFSGQWGGYNDAETGLVLLTHRFYDPSIGRWLTRDPIKYLGGINLYGYCRNNPVNSDDPTGTTVIAPPGGGNDGGGFLPPSGGGWDLPTSGLKWPCSTLDVILGEIHCATRGGIMAACVRVIGGSRPGLYILCEVFTGLFPPECTRLSPRNGRWQQL